MPINRESFEQGKILPRAEILAFLESNAERAYTIDEIYMETRATLEYSKEQLQEVVSGLEAEGRVESKVIEGVTYYIVVRRRMGFRS